MLDVDCEMLKTVKQIKSNLFKCFLTADDGFEIRNTINLSSKKKHAESLTWKCAGKHGALF